MLLYLVLAGLVKEWLSLPTEATWSTLLTSSMALNWAGEGEFALFVGQTQKNLKILYEKYLMIRGHTIWYLVRIMLRNEWLFVDLFEQNIKCHMATCSGSSCTRRVEVVEGLARGQGQGHAPQGGAETPAQGR